MDTLIKPGSQLEEKHWNNILHAIHENKCVIVLGPGSAIDNNNVQLQHYLCQQIASMLNVDMYEHSDSIFGLSEQLLKQGGLGDLANLMLTTYNDAVPNDIHNQLAQLPVSLYISSSPDVMLKKAMQTANFDYNFSYYHPKKCISVEEEPTVKKPLIYNLFGCIEEEDSCIITHDHLFEFLFSILGIKPIPEVVLNSIKKAKNFIFLGFDFESWFLNLMLRKFGLHEKTSLPSYAFSLSGMQPVTQQFFKNKFNLIFVNNTTSIIEQFVKELYTRYKSYTKGAMLRQPQLIPTTSFKDKLIDLIKENELDEIFVLLEGKFKNTDSYIDIALVHRQFRELKTQRQLGIKKDDDIVTETNKISYELINFIKRI